MQLGVLTVGTTAVQVPLVTPLNFLYGLRLLAREGNSGNVYVGIVPNINTSGGNLVAQGAPATSNPTTIPAEHITQQGAAGQVWLVADASNQTVDWSAA